MTYLNSDAVKYLIVHCAATPPAMDIGVEEIDRWHKERGWRGCGYHLVIRRDGEVETGRQLDDQGAHVRGFNGCSIGICLVGGLLPSKTGPDINYTPEQFEALRDTIDSLRRDHFPDAEIRGHYQFDNHKTCPNFDVEHWYQHDEVRTTI